jgi:hypothetical protein
MDRRGSIGRRAVQGAVMISVAVYSYANSKRANAIAEAMHEGALRYGLYSERHKRLGERRTADIACAYGWISAEAFKAHPNFVMVDLGYWQRDWKGYHRIAVNSWDTATNMLRGCPSDRFDRLGLAVAESADVSDRDTVLIAGMSEKGARTHGYGPGVWENSTCEIVRRLCPEFRPVIRPKPGRRSPIVRPLADDLAQARIVLTHHSNVAIDAALVGIPSHAVKGAGSLLSTGILAAERLRGMIARSREERYALACDCAYAQWNVDEMRSGAVWEYILQCLD